jgi:hypothetical protein
MLLGLFGLGGPEVLVVLAVLVGSVVAIVLIRRTTKNSGDGGKF